MKQVTVLSVLNIYLISLILFFITSDNFSRFIIVLAIPFEVFQIEE